MKSTDVGSSQRVGPYRLVAPIGSGKTGVVWVARAPETGREVALRLLSEATVASRHFPSRWQSLRDLSVRRPVHPAIADVHLLGEDVHQRYVVTELVRGESLADRLSREPHPTAQEAFSIAAQVAEALDWAHQAGVAHGAVKPSNVFIGEQDLVKVTDFVINQGLVPPRPSVEESVQVAGYSPEQLAGLDTTPASDLFSLGVLLYQMLRGEPPFPGANPREIARRYMRDRAPSLSGLNLSVPDSVLRACELCLAKDPHLRPSPRMIAPLLRQAAAGELALMTESVAMRSTYSTSTVVAEQVPAAEWPAGRTADVGLGQPSRHRRSPGLRSIALVTIGAVLLSTIIAAALMVSRGQGPERSPAPASRPSVTSTAGVEVPNLVGMSASKARRRLLSVGLEIHELVPVVSTPGVVVRTEPPPGEAVGPRTRVTLFVGVERERLGPEQSPSTG